MTKVTKADLHQALENNRYEFEFNEDIIYLWNRFSEDNDLEQLIYANDEYF